MIEWIAIASALLFAIQQDVAAARKELPTAVPSVRIWGSELHCAFTDLVRHRSRFFCAFREASGHMPGADDADGVIRIIVSDDGSAWSSAARIAQEGVDLRDPKLSVTPDGRLMVLAAGGTYEDGKLIRRTPCASFSNAAGDGFSDFAPLGIAPGVATANDWLWRVTWHANAAWGVVYQPAAEEDWGLQLVRSADGIDYELVCTLDPGGLPNEATVRFLPDATMVIVVRRGGEDRSGMIGSSNPPYREWTWHPIGIRLGGPDLVCLHDGALILGTRHHGEEKGEYTTILGRLELDGTFTHLVDLPSSGDTSYPGLLVHEDELWVSYYSSHEGPTAIYLARVPLGLLTR